MPDEQARYEELYRTHHARIVRLCRLLLNDRHEAEETAQEVFLKLLRASKVYTRPIPWERWITQVALNACRDRRRSGWWKWQKEKRMELEEEMSVPSSDPTPEEAVVGREERERIWRVFRQFSTRQQEVFVLRYVEGWSGNEVAELLGMNPGSVKRHLFRAVHRLRKALGGQK